MKKLYYLINLITIICLWDKNTFVNNFKDKGILFNYLQNNPNKIFIYLKNTCQTYAGTKILWCKQVKKNIKKLYKRKLKESIVDNLKDVNLFCKNNKSKICSKLKKLKNKSINILNKKYHIKVNNKNINKILYKKCSLRKKPKLCLNFKKIYMKKIRRLVRNPFVFFEQLEKTCNFQSPDKLCKIGYYLLLKWVNKIKNKISFE